MRVFMLYIYFQNVYCKYAKYISILKYSFSIRCWFCFHKMVVLNQPSERFKYKIRWNNIAVCFLFAHMWLNLKWNAMKWFNYCIAPIFLVDKQMNCIITIKSNTHRIVEAERCREEKKAKPKTRSISLCERWQNGYNWNDGEDTPLRSIAFCCAPLYQFGRFIELNVCARQFWWRRQRTVSMLYICFEKQLSKTGLFNGKNNVPHNAIFEH